MEIIPLKSSRFNNFLAITLIYFFAYDNENILEDFYEKISIALNTFDNHFDYFHSDKWMWSENRVYWTGKKSNIK